MPSGRPSQHQVGVEVGDAGAVQAGQHLLALAAVLGQAADQEPAGRVHRAVVEPAEPLLGQHPGQPGAGAVGGEAGEGVPLGHDEVAAGGDGHRAHSRAEVVPAGRGDRAAVERALVHGAGDDVHPQQAPAVGVPDRALAEGVDLGRGRDGGDDHEGSSPETMARMAGRSSIRARSGVR
nr:hypothetical protein [Nonomuraea wenchangensis]